eukprot:2597376-Amphidinium_carterae.5
MPCSNSQLVQLTLLLPSGTDQSERPPWNDCPRNGARAGCSALPTSDGPGVGRPAWAADLLGRRSAARLNAALPYSTVGQ